MAAALSPAYAQGPPAARLEYQIKAAFLYNFARFVDWPAEKQNEKNQILVGIYGKDPFGSTLEQTLQGKTVGGRPLAIRRLTTLAGVKQCHILFISSAEKKNLGLILEVAGEGGVLTVGESAKFAEEGGMVNFAMRDNTVGLEVNVSAAERAHLTISSKLLRLAKLVGKERTTGRD